MVEKDLLTHTHKHREVRGFDLRRLAVTRAEWLDLVMSYRGMRIFGDAYFDGALVRRIHNPAVVAAIREWDLLP